MSKAKDVMQTHVHAVQPDDSIRKAMDIMRSHEIRHLLVTDGARLLGVLSNRDYRRVLERADANGTIHRINEIRVEEIMTTGERLITAHRDTPILSIAQLMVLAKVGCVPIVDDQKRPIGILTQTDVMTELAEARLPTS